MNKIRVLVVDDDLSSCRLLAQILEKEGYQVDQATGGRRALDLMRENTYQVAFLDIRLPEMSGLDLLAGFKKAAGPQTEVIMHTAYASLETSIEALNKGAFTYIIKPFHPQEVRLAVKRALDRQKLELENAHLIEDLRKQNLEMETAYRQLEDLSYRLIVSEKMAALNTLGGGIAHELNNPLTSILGMNRLLLDQETPGSDRYQQLEKVQAEVMRCAAIVKDLLTFCRQASGKWEAVDLNEVIAKTLRLLNYRLEKEGVKVDAQFQGDLPPVKGVSGQLGQAILNILLNALEAVAGKEKGMIKIKTSLLADTVVVEFKDNGRGIPREISTRIFEPFFTTKEPGAGAGMGLAVCEGIMRSCGGTVSFESKVSEGSTFRLTMPAAPVQD